jgi:hypothetical protein
MIRVSGILLLSLLVGCGQQRPIVVQPVAPQMVATPAAKPLPYAFQVFPEYAGEQHIYRLNQETGAILRINVVRQKDGTFTTTSQTVSPATP